MFRDDRPFRSRIILGKPEGGSITTGGGRAVPARVKNCARGSVSQCLIIIFQLGVG